MVICPSCLICGRRKWAGTCWDCPARWLPTLKFYKKPEGHSVKEDEFLQIGDLEKKGAEK